jgi:ChaC-like protein
VNDKPNEEARDLHATADTDGRTRPIAISDVMITRDSLVNGTFLKAARTAAARAGISAVRSDAEIEERVAQSLAAATASADTWVFAYGSLMWNPTFRHIARQRASLPQWRTALLHLASGRPRIGGAARADARS